MVTHNKRKRNRCDICRSRDNLTRVAMRYDDEEMADIPDERIVWLCEDDYSDIIESDEYDVRELPNGINIGHDSHKEVEESGEEYVVILEEGNENKWLKVPERFEIDLSDII